VEVGFLNDQGGALGFPAATAGAQAAVKYINHSLGGIDGHPVKLVTCFVASAEEQGQACAEQMVNNKKIKLVVFGNVATGNQSFEAVNQGQKAILLGNSVGSGDATAKNAFILNGNPFTLLGGIATYAKSVLKAKTAAIVYPNTAMAAGGVAALEQALKTDGITYKAVAYDPTATDLTAPLVAAGASSADFVVPLVSTPPDCIDASKALTSLNITKPIVVAGSFCYSAPVLQGLGGHAPRWVQVSSQSLLTNASLPDIRAFRKASAASGLPVVDQTNADAATSWSLLLTAARFINAAGGVKATTAGIVRQAKTFSGPLALGAPILKCGAVKGSPGLCGVQTQLFKYDGGQHYAAVSGWLEPPGLSVSK
jgi:branched-chain amino acid transport system substrate-binding protein